MKLHLCFFLALPAVFAAALPADGSILTIIERYAGAGGYAYIEDPFEDAFDTMDDFSSEAGNSNVQGAVNIGNEETAFAQGDGRGSLIASSSQIRFDGTVSAMFCTPGDYSPSVYSEGFSFFYCTFSVSENVLVDISMSTEVFGSLFGISTSSYDGYVYLTDINGELFFGEGLFAGDLDGSDSISFAIDGLQLQPGEYNFYANMYSGAAQFSSGEGCAEISGRLFGEIKIASSSVPEPSSIAMFGTLLGLAGFSVRNRRSRRRFTESLSECTGA